MNITRLFRSFPRPSVFSVGVFIIFLAFCYRMVNLTAQNLWIDEGFTWFLTQQNDIMQALITDVHPPFYFASVTLWVQWAGTSELSLRYFSLLPSVLSVAMIFALARELIPPKMPQLRPVVWLAMLYLALSDMEIYTAQEARAYALHTFLALLSLWAFMRWQRLQQAKVASVWVIATTLLVYTHYLGAFVGVVQGLYALAFLRGGQRLRAITYLCVAGALFGVWAIAVILPYQLTIVQINTTADSSTIGTLLAYARSFLSSAWVWSLGIIGMGILWRTYRTSALLLGWVLVPVIVTFIANIPSSRLLFDYRLSQITPAIALLLAWGTVRFEGQARVFLISMLVLNGVLSVDVYRTKETWHAYAQRIAEETAEGDGVLVDFGGGDYQLSYYLTQTLRKDVAHYSLRQEAFMRPSTYETDALRFLDERQTIWLIRWNTNTEAFDKLAFVGYTQTLFVPFERENNINLDLYRFDRLPPSTQPLTRFENGLTLRHTRIDPQTGRVGLWWEAAVPLTADIITSVKLFDETGQMIAQADSPIQPFTSTWQPNTRTYERKTLSWGEHPLADGRYRITLEAYLFVNERIQIIPLENANLTYTLIEFEQDND